MQLKGRTKLKSFSHLQQPKRTSKMPDVSKGNCSHENCSHKHTTSCTEDVDPHEADTRPTSPVEPTHPMLERDPWTRLNIMEDVNGTSIVPTVDQLICSHVHKTSGAVRSLKKDVIIWTDFPYKKAKESFGVIKCIVPWEDTDGETSGSYTFFNVATSPTLPYWGIAPTMGTIQFESDNVMKELGCYFGTMPNPFTQQDRQLWTGANATVQYMALSYERITQEPWQTNLDRHCKL